MSKYCSDCWHLNIDKKLKKGDKEIAGIYLCALTKEYTNASKNACEKFERNYKGAAKQQELYNEGKEAAKGKDTIPISVYVFVLIVCFIIWVIGKLTGH